MKIRKISLENLNSLVGPHELDLAADPIASAGIFAITGPTGAGKSTLLDAITLALYGRAARYDSPNPEDMMSRHQGSCRAEVEFEVRGEIYRASWTRHRARSKAKGRMQSAKRSVSNAGGTVLTQSLNDATAKIEEITGLNYQRFMRSVLLAQGEFARFLKSSEDERAGLLESLTGTEIFSALSQRVYEENSRRVKAIEQEEAALGMIRPLTVEQLEEKHTALKKLESEGEQIQIEAKKSQSLLLKAEEVAKINAALAEAEKALGAVRAQHKQQSTEFEKLALHRSGEPIFPLLTRFEEKQAALKAAELQCSAAQSKQKEASTNLESGVAAAASLVRKWVTDRESALGKLDAEEKSASAENQDLESWLKARRSDKSLAEVLPELFEKIESLKIQRKHWSDSHGKIVALKADLKSANDEDESRSAKIKEAGKLLGAAEKQMKQIEEKLVRTTGDRDRAAEQIAIQQLEQLIGLREKDSLAAKSIKEAEAEVKILAEKLKSKRDKVAAETELLAERQEHLQTERLRASLEEHRADLEPGSPCPLCGSTEHPLAAHGSPSEKSEKLEGKVAKSKSKLQKHQAAERELVEKRSAADTLAKTTKESRSEIVETIAGLTEKLSLGENEAALEAILEKSNSKLRTLEKLDLQKKDAERKLDQCQRVAERLQLERETAKGSLAKIDRQLKIENTELAQALRAGEKAQEQLEEALGPFSELVPAPGKEPALRQSLKDRASQFSERQTKLEQNQATIKDADARRKSLQQELETFRERARGLQSTVSTDGPQEKWDFQTPAAMDQRLAALDTAATSATATLEERKTQTTKASDELAAAESALNERLDDSSFATIDDLRSSRLNEELVKALGEQQKKLEGESGRLKGKIEGMVENVCRMRSEGAIPEGEELAALRIRNQDLEATGKVIADQASTVRSEIKTDEQNRQRLKTIDADLKKSRAELLVWQRLNGLVGSADGKKFRRFAQGLSLDLLVRHANVHLERLSDRYQLARREGEELGLEIIDLFQASVTRPMSSLSGGESFLASLALALGLSDLAGRKVQIDSLFIDEGFGSLDGDTLDEAISALESLRLRDKTVGIISHVELLKERISTQVRVSQGADGRGSLEVRG